jgi:hypothetical protein
MTPEHKADSASANDHWVNFFFKTKLSKQQTKQLDGPALPPPLALTQGVGQSFKCRSANDLSNGN